MNGRHVVGSDPDNKPKGPQVICVPRRRWQAWWSGGNYGVVVRRVQAARHLQQLPEEQREQSSNRDNQRGYGS